ncbi:HeH/LEM domain-containing protein [Limosilactobacillus reuteri]|uniref:HeH/LEM domain-containing protein n=1 Tax=Limosilactobacillus reuteri TaxID=1598 RepID=UPI0039846455
MPYCRRTSVKITSPSGDDGKSTTPSTPKPGGDTNGSQNKPASSAVASSAPSSSATSTSSSTDKPATSAQPAVVDTFNPNGDVKPTEDQTIPEIKAYLDAHKISYASSASKPDLLALVNK